MIFLSHTKNSILPVLSVFVKLHVPICRLVLLFHDKICPFTGKAIVSMPIVPVVANEYELELHRSVLLDFNPVPIIIESCGIKVVQDTDPNSILLGV